MSDGEERTKRVKDDCFTVEGVVVEALANALFRIDVPNGKSVLARPAGKLRMNRIRILPGDRVDVEISSYDPTRGRITYRYR